jgi:hypothetical protein
MDKSRLLGEERSMPGKHIKVIGEDRMCFWVDAATLEPAGCGSFDPWAFSDPERVPSMDANEWNARRYALARERTYGADATGAAARLFSSFPLSK